MHYIASGISVALPCNVKTHVCQNLSCNFPAEYSAADIPLLDFSPAVKMAWLSQCSWLVISLGKRYNIDIFCMAIPIGVNKNVFKKGNLGWFWPGWK